mgnify:CR=1 FL=1
MGENHKFNCCFEKDEKGIFMTVAEGSKCMEFNIHTHSVPGTGVCLRKTDVEDLIKLLQGSLKNL